MKNLHFIALGVIFSAGSFLCIARRKPKRGSCQKKEFRPQLDKYMLPAKNKPITIFIHGGGKPISSLFTFPGFHESCPQGLVPYHSLFCSGCTLGKKVAECLNDGDAEKFPMTAFYIFGWSGQLSFKHREDVGRQLYYIITQFKNDPQYKDQPITLITHSHGGNAALQIGVEAAKHDDTRPLIDQLIIMGCPVVSISNDLVSSPIFNKKTIILFSQSDAVQRLDPQGLYPQCASKKYCTPFWSGRRFEPSEHIIQAELKTNNRSQTGHLGFVTRKFLKHLPELINMLNNPEERKQFPIDSKGSLCVNFDTRRLVLEGCSRCR